MICYRRASGAKGEEGIGKPTFIYTRWSSGQIEGKPKLGFPLIAATSLRKHPSGQTIQTEETDPPDSHTGRPAPPGPHGPSDNREKEKRKKNSTARDSRPIKKPPSTPHNHLSPIHFKARTTTRLSKLAKKMQTPMSATQTPAPDPSQDSYSPSPRPRCAGNRPARFPSPARASAGR